MTHILYRNESYKMCIQTEIIYICIIRRVTNTYTKICRIDAEFLFIFYRIAFVYQNKHFLTTLIMNVNYSGAVINHT